MPPKEDAGLSDQESLLIWIARYRHGDNSSDEREWAEQHLFNRLYPIALRIANLKTKRSSYDAEQVAMDAVQSIFKNYIEVLAFECETDGKVISLLETTTENCKNEALRKQAAFARSTRDANGSPLLTVSLEFTRIDAKSHAVDPAILCEHHDQIDHCLKQLKDPLLCQVFQSREQGLTYKEIANRLGLDERQLRSCKRSIRKILSPQTNHEPRTTKHQAPSTKHQAQT